MADVIHLWNPVLSHNTLCCGVSAYGPDRVNVVVAVTVLPAMVTCPKATLAVGEWR